MVIEGVDMSVVGHGIVDGALVIFLFMLGIITNGLRTAIRDSRIEQQKLSEAINKLTVTISKDYITRAEADKDNEQVWERLDRHSEQISNANNRLTRLER